MCLPFDVGPYRPKHLRLVSLPDGCVLSAIDCATPDDEIRGRWRLEALRERWLQNAVHISGEHLAVLEA